MAFRPPPKILEKTLRFKTLKHEGGRFYLWDHSALIDPLITQAYYIRLLEKTCGEQNIHFARYQAGKMQATKGLEIINKRFGYAKTIPDKKRLFEFNAGQSEILGFGKYNWKLDFTKNYFVGTTKSPYAEEYKKIWGIQKHPIDYWFMGAWAGCTEAIIKKPVVCIETQCLAKGNQYCQFVIQPTEKWKKSDPKVKEQSFLFQKPPSIPQLAK